MEENKTKADEFISYINLKRKNFNCPMCQTSNWMVSDKVFELRQFNWWNLAIGWVPITPVITVTCSECWNTVLINAKVTNLLDNQVEDGESKSN